MSDDNNVVDLGWAKQKREEQEAWDSQPIVDVEEFAEALGKFMKAKGIELTRSVLNKEITATAQIKGHYGVIMKLALFEMRDDQT